jgi:phosphomethylpyrimidine synthase
MKSIDSTDNLIIAGQEFDSRLFNCCDPNREMDKVRLALEMKTDAIMDLRCYGKTREFRRRLVAMSPAMIGSGLIYDAVGFFDKGSRGIDGR